MLTRPVVFLEHSGKTPIRKGGQSCKRAPEGGGAGKMATPVERLVHEQNTPFLQYAEQVEFHWVSARSGCR